ncbi:hypothetical protein ETAR_17500 [Edwardsiella tarda]
MTIELNINANIIAHKFAEVTCNDNPCGFIVKIKDNLYHAINHEGESQGTHKSFREASENLAKHYVIHHCDDSVNTCNDNKYEIKDEDEFDVFIERLSQKLANHIINNVKNKQHSIH